MSHRSTLSLITLPVEIVYRIFDHLELKGILLSARGVCQRLEDILDTYQHPQVNKMLLFQYR
jgi:hypothetical protein